MYTNPGYGYCDNATSSPNHISKSGIRYDILKLLYAGMLLGFTPDKVRQFWKEHPLPQIKPENESHVFKELLQGRSWYSTEYAFSVFNDVEDFLIENGTSFPEFIENSFYRVNQGLPVSPRNWLSMSKPIFKLFFTEPDLRALIVHLINHYLGIFLPIFKSEVVLHTSEDDWNISILSINYDSILCSGVDLNKQMSKVDLGLLFLSIIRKLPECFRVPRYEHPFMVADRREISDIVQNVSIEDNLLYISDRLYAKKTSPDIFCTSKGINSSVFENSNTSVWVMCSDYFCPIRKRVVLHKGCAYGAPKLLLGFRYLKYNASPSNLLDSLIDDIVDFNDRQWSEIKEQHNKLIMLVSGTNNFTYNHKNETMQLNGIELIRNVPAKILRKIILIYLETGRTEFYHKEFTKDDSIINDPYQPNFTVRLKRLMTTLETRNTSIEIQKLYKGKFIFNPLCKINYSEID